MATDGYASAVRADERLGAVFECDDETRYFYLLDMNRPDGEKIVGALNVTSIVPSTADVEVCWSGNGHAVGLFGAGSLLALFDTQGINGEAVVQGRTANESDARLFTKPLN